MIHDDVFKAPLGSMEVIIMCNKYLKCNYH